MSDRWWLRLGQTQLQWAKNEIPSKLLTVFREKDKYVDDRWVEALAVVAGADDENNLTPVQSQRTADADDAGSGPEGEEEEDPEEDLALELAYEYLDSAPVSTAFGYRTPVAVAVERLKLMGFTAERCHHEMRSLLLDLYDNQDPIEIGMLGGDSISMRPAAVLDRGLRALTASQNGAALSQLTDVDKACLNAIDYFWDQDHDPRILLAVQLHNADRDDALELDLHDLLSAGYFEPDQALAQLSLEQLAEDTASTGPIIIVTEGSSDADLLQLAMASAAPAVADFFRFLDFDAKPAGGADQVVRTLRSFSAAGVMNRVVGVLDNDVAGRAAAQQLDRTPLLPHVRYRVLPDVPYGVSYPTLGPGGRNQHDVNGRAVSIEFQFGLDNLRDDDGELIPVRWTSFDKRSRDYQGELVDKELVKNRIRAMLRAANTDHDREAPPWPTIHGVVQMLVDAAFPTSFPGCEFGPTR